MADHAFRDSTPDIEAALERRLPGVDNQPGRLYEAMRDAVLGGGKRIRPRLVFATGETLDIAPARLEAAACAVEFVHAYSLIHDDLPAMDDDALRRGKPTTHVAFDEATAILAGDALQSLAFDVIAHDGALAECPGIRAALVSTLARAIGAHGMVGGQALDMASESRDLDIDTLERLHAMKTGALLRAAVMMAADCADNLDDERRATLDRFASKIGMAFQVRDDVLDIESSTDKLGKTQGADIVHGKATYPALLGLDAARNHADRLYNEAVEALAIFGKAGAPLRALAAEIVKRDH